MNQLLNEAVKRLVKAKADLDNVRTFVSQSCIGSKLPAEMLALAMEAERTAEAKFYSAAVMVCAAYGTDEASHE